MTEDPRIKGQARLVSQVGESDLAELDRALWNGRTLRGLADAASPQTHRDLLDTILAAGWRPPLPESEDNRIRKIRAVLDREWPDETIDDANFFIVEEIRTIVGKASLSDPGTGEA